MLRRVAYLIPLVVMGSILLSACGAGGQQSSKAKLAPVSALPKQMQDAPVAVRTAYQFAVANPEALKNSRPTTFQPVRMFWWKRSCRITVSVKLRAVGISGMC